MTVLPRVEYYRLEEVRIGVRGKKMKTKILVGYILCVSMFGDIVIGRVTRVSNCIGSITYWKYGIQVLLNLLKKFNLKLNYIIMHLNLYIN